MGDVAPRVLIAGGSLGGLTAALSLREAGCDVEVYERSQAPLEGRGAGIVLHPASIRYFIESGAMDVGRVSSRADSLRYLDRGGNTIHEAPCRYWFTSYYTLHKGLLGCFDESRYHLAAGMIGLHQEDGSISLELSDGGEVKADLLVCADGIHSTARRLLLPDVSPSYAGYVGWRGTVREDELTAGTLAFFATPAPTSSATEHTSSPTRSPTSTGLSSPEIAASTSSGTATSPRDLRWMI